MSTEKIPTPEDIQNAAHESQVAYEAHGKDVAHMELSDKEARDATRRVLDLSNEKWKLEAERETTRDDLWKELMTIETEHTTQDILDARAELNSAATMAYLDKAGYEEGITKAKEFAARNSEALYDAAVGYAKADGVELNLETPSETTPEPDSTEKEAS